MRHCLFLFICLSIVKTGAQSSVLSVADSLYSMGNYSKAIETYKTHPIKEEVLESIAKAYEALGNFDEAILYYDSALDYDQENSLLKYDYAKLLARTKQYKKAGSFFTELINSDDQNPNFYYELGLVHEKQVDTLGLAQKSFKTAFELDNAHQKAIYKLAKYNLQSMMMQRFGLKNSLVLESLRNLFMKN